MNAKNNTLIHKILYDPLIGGIFASSIGLIITLIKGVNYIGVIIGFVGFIYSKKAYKSNKSLALLGSLMGLIPILLFFISYFLGSR